MTTQPPIDPAQEPDREKVLAAEYSLGLLEGEELMAARGRMATDPVFVAKREWWDDWFVPYSDEVEGAEPGAHVWDAISAEISAKAKAAELVSVAPPSANDDTANVALIDMERRVRRWQWTAGLTSAAAALAVALFVMSPSASPISHDTPTIAAADSAPLMASIPIGDTALRLGVTYLPSSDEMLVSAAGLTADGVHDHELWLVPADGSALQSLGVIEAGTERRMALPKDITRNVGNGVKLVLTREPLGGKPEDKDAGPVVAEGAFEQV